MSSRAQKSAMFKETHNCCQAVLLAFKDELPMDSDMLISLGSCFGSGMGGMKGTCGALAGAEMVLGLKGYKGSSMNRYSRELFARFEEKCGSTVCADIKGVLSGHTLCSCADCCRYAAEIVEEMLEKEVS